MNRYFGLTVSLGLAMVFGACAGSGGAASPGVLSSPSPVPAPGPLVTRTITGTVVDYENDRPLAGVTVTAPNGSRSITDGSGSFRFVYEASLPVPPQSEASVLCEKDGYDAQWAGLTRDIDVTVRARMRRSVILMDASRVTELLLNVFGYYVGEPYDSDYCNPCRRITLRTSAAGQVRVTVRWNGHVAVHAWAAEGMITAAPSPDSESLTFDVPVTREAVAYIGLPYTRSEPVPASIPVEITTTVLER